MPIVPQLAIANSLALYEVITRYEKYKAKGKASMESSALSGITSYMFNINIELKAEIIRIRYPQLAFSSPRTTTK